MLFWFEFPVGIQTILVNCTSSVRKDFMQLSSICNYPYFPLLVWLSCTWVIPCQLIHFFADPSPILMKFGKLGGQQKKQIHTKFQLISTIFNGVRALWWFEEFYRTRKLPVSSEQQMPCAFVNGVAWVWCCLLSYACVLFAVVWREPAAYIT